MSTKKTLLTASLVLTLLLAAPALATPPDYYVDCNGSDDANCLRWDTACETIQCAIDKASAGDSIAVKECTYTLTSTINVNKVVHIYGGFDGTETQLSQRNWKQHTTIVDGNGSVGCFFITASGTINGFTITNGSDGGGIGICDCDAIIENCFITGNATGDNGGGISIGINNCTPIVRNCVLANNTAGGIGGGIEIDDSDAYIINCTIYGNYAEDEGGGIGDPYGIGFPTITNCIFAGNTVGEFGGDPNISSCLTVTYSRVDVAGTGNTNTDPCFVDYSDPNGSDNKGMTTDDGLILTANSTYIIDDGNNSASGLPSTDILKEPRIIDGDGDQTATVDMGAYEYDPS